MATHSSILAWKIPWTEEPGRLKSMGSQRVGVDLATERAHAPWIDNSILGLNYSISTLTGPNSLLILANLACSPPIIWFPPDSHWCFA